MGSAAFSMVTAGNHAEGILVQCRQGVTLQGIKLVREGLHCLLCIANLSTLSKVIIIVIALHVLTSKV